MSYAKTGIWENWLLEKESVLILISQYSLKFHLDQRVKPAKSWHEVRLYTQHNCELNETLSQKGQEEKLSG